MYARWALAVLTLVAVLAACSSGSSSSSGSKNKSSSNGTPIVVQSYSGTPQALDGTWMRCTHETQDNQDEKDTFTFAGATFTATFDAFPFNSVCTGALTHMVTFSGTMTVTGTKSTVTWTNRVTASGNAPVKAGGGGTLPDPVTASVLTGVVSASDNTTAVPLVSFDMLRYIDDSGPVWFMYEEEDSVAACIDGSPAGNCLLNTDQLDKQ
jgi:hypothetical protein